MTPVPLTIVAFGAESTTSEKVSVPSEVASEVIGIVTVTWRLPLRILIVPVRVP